jgi:glycosyltransferase involved in cell wall biosynthesis
VLRHAFRQAAPRLDPRAVAALTRLKRRLVSSGGTSPARLVFDVARDGYRRHLQHWLSPHAMAKVTRAEVRLLALLGRRPQDVADTPLPSRPLELGGGPVYLTFLNIGDERKNYESILSAFLLAFQDRPDVTLVVKLVTNRLRERHETDLFIARYRAMGLAHRCRVVLITEFLSNQQMSELYRVTTFYVNASFGEGACLPLMRALAGGRPAIAPDHTAMADYIDDSVAFVLRCHPEPTHWPHDPEKRLATSRQRVVWTDLRDAFLRSAEVAADSERYAAMAHPGRARMAAQASAHAATEALRAALDRLPADAAEYGQAS